MCNIDESLTLDLAKKLGYNQYVSSDGETIVWSDKFGQFSITCMPANPRVGISHSVHIYSEYQGLGFGTLQHTHRLALAKKLGFLSLIATVNNDNIPETKSLRRHGWKQIVDSVFEPTPTTSLWVKELQ